MSALALLLLLSCESPTEVSARPVVSLSPNWVPILYGDSVTLTCNLDPNPEGEKRYFWYRDNEQIQQYQQSFRINYARWFNKGNYQCRAGTSKKSDAVRLAISKDQVILQALPSVHEGKSLSLRCYSGRHNSTENAVFTKNGIAMESTGAILYLQADRNTTGTYKCSKPLSMFPFTRHSREEFINIEGAGTKPEVAINPESGPILVMDSVTLTCIVASTLPESRRYIWYRDGDWIPKERKTFTLNGAQEKDSGHYQCQIPGSERSDPVRIDVERERSHLVPVLIGILIGAIVITAVIIFKFGHKLTSLLMSHHRSEQDQNVCRTPGRTVQGSDTEDNLYSTELNDDLPGDNVGGRNPSLTPGDFTYVNIKHAWRATPASRPKPDKYSVAYAVVKGGPRGMEIQESSDQESPDLSIYENYRGPYFRENPLSD